MAKFEKGRVYFEKIKVGFNGLEEYIEEIGQVIGTGITDTLFICDHVYFGKENNDSLCDVFITISNESSEKEDILTKSNWWKIISTEIRNSETLNLGIWKSQTEVIDEIKSKFTILKIEEYDEQLLLNIRVSSELIDYFENNSFDNSNRLKWFDFVLITREQEEERTKMISTHSGHDYSIYKSDKSAVDSILTILEGSLLQVYIMPTRE